MKLLLHLTLVCTLYLNSCEFAPGSYPYAEVYELETTEDDLIRAVKEFKMDNPNYNVPTHVGLIDGRDQSSTDYWYHIWFYYSDENKIIYTWVRDNKIALISVNDGTELGNWDRINKDLNHVQSREEKKSFEARILNELKKKL